MSQNSADRDLPANGADKAEVTTLTTPLIACEVCGQVHAEPALTPNTVAECARCGSRLRRRTSGSFHLTAALTLCALLLYGPANLFPILRMNFYGRVTENTVYSGVVGFYKNGDYFVAAAVFLASIVIPFLKILGLLFLVLSSKFHFHGLRRTRVQIYRIIDSLGKWAMLDVFALAILISLIKLQRLATVVPGPGVFAFTLVIMFTIMASASFDPQTIWEEEDALA